MLSRKQVENVTTNPSIGLPEELRDMGIATLGVLRCLPESSLHLQAIDDHTRDVLDWACKRVCLECARGGIPEWSIAWQKFVHPGRYIYDYKCRASVLREGITT